jgi:hypothetical protein
MVQHEGENAQPVETALSLTQKLVSRMLRLSCHSAICRACGLMQRQLFLLWHEKQWMQLVDRNGEMLCTLMC